MLQSHQSSLVALFLPPLCPSIISNRWCCSYWWTTSFCLPSLSRVSAVAFFLMCRILALGDISFWRVQSWGATLVWWMLMFLLWLVSLVVSCLHVHSWQPWQPSSLGVAYYLFPKKTAMIPGQVQVPITSSQKDSFLEALRRDVSWLAGERLMDYSLLTADSWRCSPQVTWDQNWGLLVAIKDVKPESTKGLPCGQPYIYQTKLDTILTKKTLFDQNGRRVSHQVVFLLLWCFGWGISFEFHQFEVLVVVQSRVPTVHLPLVDSYYTDIVLGQVNYTIYI